MGPIRKLILLCAAAVFLAGCMPDSPRTALDWGVNDTLHRRAKTYTYQDQKPAAKPTNYVSRDAAPYAKVSTQTLPPIAAPAGDAPAFAWPVSGRVISDFGATANGGKNDGINIAAAWGTPIRASAAGTVTYAGNELKDYGNLVLVKHSGGYTTAYAHAERLVVARGDFVARGQVIAYTGQTGDVSTPQVHFEIRSATVPVNPRSYLTSNTASN
ncbi:MAG TPA: M23 family metallopeptidase [Rhizomicrobium sp.]|nr:M23 family metallopeptidase [Rhizomicrobium sp.]